MSERRLFVRNSIGKVVASVAISADELRKLCCALDFTPSMITGESDQSDTLWIDVLDREEARK